MAERFIPESELKNLQFNEEAIALALIRHLLRIGRLTPEDIRTIAVDLEEREVHSGSTNRPHQVLVQIVHTTRYAADEPDD